MQQTARFIPCLLGCLGLCSVSVTASAGELICRPEYRLECAGMDCSWITSGFQHAEFFLVDDALGELGACLWTNCYAGKASYAEGHTAGTRVASATLEPLNGMPGYSPIRVVLSLGDNARFSSALIDGVDSVVLSFGQCADESVESKRLRGTQEP